ncbi:snare associated Golgi protein-domain-containing protein [Globomyces pollinis-pini]|nr:snare associated Golgi protein-domain-containing protein [Globomyces pollinis-pini]
MLKKYQQASIIAICSILTFSILYLNMDLLSSGMVETFRFIQSHKLIGSLIYIFGFAIFSCLLLPVSVPTIMAGMLFKPLFISVLMVILGSQVGIIIAYSVGNTFLRPWILKKMQDPKIRAVDRALAKQGSKIVVLLRLSPVFPYGLCNYVFSGSSISMPTVMLASLIGDLPLAIVFCGLGTMLGGVDDEVTIPLRIKLLTTLLSVCFCVCSSVFIGVITKRALGESDVEEREGMLIHDGKPEDTSFSKTDRLFLSKVFVTVFVILVVGIPAIFYCT